MNINGSVALVTGGNRGLGKAFVQALLDADRHSLNRQMQQVWDSSKQEA